MKINEGCTPKLKPRLPVSQERHFGELYKVRTELKSLDIYRHRERQRKRESNVEKHDYFLIPLPSKGW